MPDKTYTSQKDPPEGSRKVIERELARQDKREPKGQDRKEPRTAGRPPHEAKESGAKTER
jgi:hypothetical protein